jgi:hypothetical protein
MYLLAITDWIPLGLTAVGGSLLTLIISVIKQRFNKKKEDELVKEQNKKSSWNLEIDVNHQIKQRLGAIKTKLGAERVCLFAHHNGLVTGSQYHLKRFSLHSLVKDSHVDFDIHKYINVSCSIYNDFYAALQRDGKIILPDIEKGTSELAATYREQGMVACFAWPIWIDGIYWGVVTATNWENKPNLSKVDEEGVLTNIKLIINEIKRLENGKKK